MSVLIINWGSIFQYIGIGIGVIVVLGAIILFIIRDVKRDGPAAEHKPYFDYLDAVLAKMEQQRSKVSDEADTTKNLFPDSNNQN